MPGHTCHPDRLLDVLLHARPGAENGYPGLHHVSHLLRTGEAVIEQVEPDGFVLVIYPSLSPVGDGG